MLFPGLPRKLCASDRAGKLVRSVTAMVVAASCFALNVDSARASGSHLELGNLTVEPSGATGLCSRHRWACEISPASVQLNRSTFPEISRVNRRINQTVRAVSDDRQYGLSDYWTYPTGGAGDCEDFALAKKRELIARGFPANRLLLATVHSARTGPHAVLVVRLDEGDFVLDNLNDEILPWRATGYAFLRIQSPLVPGNWHNGFSNRS